MGNPARRREQTDSLIGGSIDRGFAQPRSHEVGERSMRRGTDESPVPEGTGRIAHPTMGP